MLKEIIVTINEKTNRKKQHSFCECDNCHIIFETKKLYKNYDQLTFCSKKCCNIASRKGGVAKQHREQKYFQEHGVKHPFSNPDVIAKRKQTVQERYGVDNVSQLQEVQDKIKQTTIQRFGKPYPPSWPPNQISDDEKTLIVCKVCKKEFLVLPCRKDTQCYCSKACRVIARTNTPNLKNRGKTPSQRCGSGIKGTYNGINFRSTYELSFIVNFLLKNNIQFEYETIKLQENGITYIPDFICHPTKKIYEIKNSVSVTKENIQIKLELGKNYAASIGYDFVVITDENFQMLTYDEIAKLSLTNDIVLHERKKAGIRYKQIVKLIEEQKQLHLSNNG